MSKVDPQGVALRSFGPPTEEEQKHHFLWRVRKELPDPGLIGVFDRSHYEDVLVARVDALVPPSTWESRFDEINRFESDLVEAGTTVLKFALMVSHDEQGMRLMKRLDRPDKHWKYSANDLPDPAPVGRLPGGLRRRVPSHLHRRRAVVRRSRPTTSGTPVWPSPRS